MIEITLNKLAKRYGQIDVLKDIDLKIEPGEFVILVGPSGCGKSTLLRCIAGLNSIDGGEIRFDGQVINNLPPQERNLSMVFQNYALYPHLTVRDNLAFGLKLKKLPSAEIDKRVAWAADILSITPYLDRRPRALSGGQRQRVAMGRAMVKQSGAFLFDEPLSNLDAKLRVQMRKEIRELQRALKTTAVYVTHDQVEAMTMGDRIVVMNAGRIEQVGAPLALYHDPQTQFVAGFIGSPPMNFIEGTASGQTVRLSNGLELNTRITAQGPVTVGIRPEHMLEEDAAANRLSASVRMVHELGTSVSYAADLAGCDIDVVSTARIDTPGGNGLALSIPPQRIYLFRDGQRLR